MDILEAVTTWLEQKKATGTDKLYFSEASKCQLSTFLELTRDESKLNTWLEANNRTSHEALKIEVVEPVQSQPVIKTLVSESSPSKGELVEKPDPENSQIMANEPEIELQPPVSSERPTLNTVEVVEISVPEVEKPIVLEKEANSSDYFFLKALATQTKILIIGEQVYGTELHHPFEKSIKLLQGMVKAMNDVVKKTNPNLSLGWETISLVEVCKKSYKEQDNVAYITNELSELIATTRPDVVLLMGALPIEALTGLKSSVLNIHGQWLNFHNVACMPTFHPDFLNRAAARKKDAWSDLQKVIKFLLDRSV